MTGAVDVLLVTVAAADLQLKMESRGTAEVSNLKQLFVNERP